MSNRRKARLPRTVRLVRSVPSGTKIPSEPDRRPFRTRPWGVDSDRSSLVPLSNEGPSWIEALRIGPYTCQPSGWASNLFFLARIGFCRSDASRLRPGHVSSWTQTTQPKRGQDADPTRRRIFGRSASSSRKPFDWRRGPGPLDARDTESMPIPGQMRSHVIVTWRGGILASDGTDSDPWEGDVPIGTLCTRGTHPRRIGSDNGHVISGTSID